MASALSVAVSLLPVATLACAHPAEAYPTIPGVGELVSVTVERWEGDPYPTFSRSGATYVAGEDGQPYGIRVHNRTAERLEVVLSVDGRDVISGQLGDYRRQRGYVLEPWGEVYVEGFRQSLDHVAAFRFTSLPNSYSARMGTPEHAGVIGVAVFQGRRPPARPRPQPLAPRWTPSYDHDAEEPWRSSPSPSPSSLGSAGPGHRPPSRGGAQTHETRSGTDSRALRDRSAEAYRPAPEFWPRSELGTEYGETRTSRVRPLDFRRRHRRHPDEQFAIYYDSWANLASRGVIDPPPYARSPGPQPFPQSGGFAPPPPY